MLEVTFNTLALSNLRQKMLTVLVDLYKLKYTMSDNNNPPPLPRVAYGIWLPDVGWLKSPTPAGYVAYAEPRREIAQRYARWIGNGARVEPVDMSLVALESELKRYEKERREYPRKLWVQWVGKWQALKEWSGRKWQLLLSVSKR